MGDFRISIPYHGRHLENSEGERGFLDCYSGGMGVYVVWDFK